MLNIIIGLCLLCLGICGIANSWWAVIDFVNVVIPTALVIFGILSILAGLKSRKQPSKPGK